MARPLQLRPLPRPLTPFLPGVNVAWKGTSSSNRWGLPCRRPKNNTRTQAWQGEIQRLKQVSPFYDRFNFWYYDDFLWHVLWLRDCPESFVRCLINAKSALVVYEESSLLFCEPCVLLYVVCWSMRRRQKMLSSFSRLTFYGFSSSICLEDTWKKRRKKGCQNFSAFLKSN